MIARYDYNGTGAYFLENDTTGIQYTQTICVCDVYRHSEDIIKKEKKYQAKVKSRNALKYHKIHSMQKGFVNTRTLKKQLKVRYR